MSATWRIEDDPARGREDEFLPARGTVSIAFVRGTLLRLWYVWVGSTLLGAALATSWLVLVPPPSVGVVSLLLAHDPATDQDTAMATDVTLLKTRTVAQQLADELGLDESPDDLQRTIVAEAATSSVLRIQISGSSRDDAVQRARELARTYLAFRQEQLTQQSEDLTQGYRDRADALQVQVDGLTRQYDALAARGGTEEETAEVLGQRGLLMGQIVQLQNQIETQRLESDAVILASRVLDEAALVPQSPLRRAVLGMGSGLVGGLGLGLALVVVYALTTGRLRSRADVATAMGLPVLYSAGNIVTRRRPFGRADRSSLDLLVDGLEAALPPRGKRSRRLGLVTVDCEQEGAMVLAGLARRLGADGSVLAVDLSGTGLLERELEGPPLAPGPRGAPEDPPHPSDPSPHQRDKAPGPRERPSSPDPIPQERSVAPMSPRLRIRRPRQPGPAARAGAATAADAGRVRAPGHGAVRRVRVDSPPPPRPRPAGAPRPGVNRAPAARPVRPEDVRTPSGPPPRSLPEPEPPAAPPVMGDPAPSVAVTSRPIVDAVGDVVLSFAPFEVGRGLGHVTSTASQCVVLVKAGRSTSELLSTVARAARSAGLTIQFVMLVGADSRDGSFGGASSHETDPRPR